MILINPFSFGQKWNPEIICSTDTVNFEQYVSMKYNPENMDRVKHEPYRIVQCQTRSKVGFRMGIAVSNYYYSDKTTSWIGQDGGPDINFILVIDKLNFGFRFKPWTIDPKKEIDFNGLTLPTMAKLNNVRLDYYVGYSLDFENLISVEPYIGYNRTSFHAINEDELNQKFSFNKNGGFIFGTTLNKYFKIKEHEYISILGTVG